MGLKNNNQPRMDLCHFSPTLSISGILYLQASLLQTSERAMMGGEGVRPSLYTVRHRTSWTTAHHQHQVHVRTVESW